MGEDVVEMSAINGTDHQQQEEEENSRDQTDDMDKAEHHQSFTNGTARSRTEENVALLPPPMKDPPGSSVTSEDLEALKKKKRMERKKILALSFMILTTGVFFFFELVYGFLTRSIALLADSYHMLADVCAIVVALICLILTKLPTKMGFGYVRAEVFGALINGTFLMSMCLSIALEALGRLIHPHKIKNPFQVLIVGIGGLIMNLVSIGVFHGIGHSHGGHGHSHSEESGHGHSHGGGDDQDHHESPPETRATRALSSLTAADVCHNLPPAKTPAVESRNGRRSKRYPRVAEIPLVNIRHFSTTDVTSGFYHRHIAMRLASLESEEEINEPATRTRKDAQNLNLRGVFLHVVSDAIGSVIVIVTATLTLMFGKSHQWITQYLDPLLSLALVTLICQSARMLIISTAEVVLRRKPAFIDYKELSKDIERVQGVSKVAGLHVWTLVADRHLATAEIEFCSAYAFDRATEDIRSIFHKHGVHSLTIQPSFSTECRVTFDNVVKQESDGSVSDNEIPSEEERSAKDQPSTSSA